MKRFLKMVVVIGALAPVGLSACKKADDSGERETDKADMPDQPVAPTVEGQPGQPPAGQGAARPASPGHGQPGPGQPAHGGMQVAAAQVEDGVLKLDGLELTVPKGWKSQPVKSKMRAAQLAVGEGEDAPELVVYYFGKQGAGSAADNIERWVKQFQEVEGKPETGESMVGQMKVTRVDLKGTFGGGPSMRPGAPAPAPRSDYRLIGAIIESPAGPYYLKLVGPAAKVETSADAFDDFVESAKSP